MIKCYEEKNKSNWNQALKTLPDYSILQTWEWGEIKSQFDWQPIRYFWKNQSQQIVAAAQMLIREIKIPLISKKLRTIYIPQGPLMDWNNENLRHNVLKDIREIAEGKGCFSIKIDPEVKLGFGEKLSDTSQELLAAKDIVDSLNHFGWIYSTQQVQFKNTAWINISIPEEDLLSAMKQKTRYNIRLSRRKGVSVRRGGLEDLEILYQMYLKTSLRDGFIIRPKEYYLTTWSEFMLADLAIPLIAEVESTPIAGMILFHFGERSWYLYGMSTEKHREKMPNYLLQWEAIRYSKELNCEIYDLWGAPDIFSEEDRMWGVYRFKKGLGCVVVQRIGAFDLPLKKITYKIFIDHLPRILNITRKIRKAQQMQELN